MAKHYDAIIIGAGQAGPSLAVDLAKSGMHVAIIERKLFGGTCVNTGCIPSKTLFESAYKAHIVNKSSTFGVDINRPVTVNMKKVKARKDKIVINLRDSLENWLKNTENCDVYKGYGHFEEANKIKVNDELLISNKIFLNVGGRARIPNIPGLGNIKFLTNSSIMELEEIPNHLIIVGGSYTGLEFAQMFKRFGSQVTIIEQSQRLISLEDEDISDRVKDILEEENINILLSTEINEIKRDKEEISLMLNLDNREITIKGSHLLLATGRKPNTDDLGLDKIGMQVDKKGYIIVDDHLNTSIPGIWALGECNGKGAFTHTSYNDYQIIAANLLNKKSKSLKDRILAYNLYIDPPLGRVGQNETQAKEAGRKILVAKKEMRSIERAIIKGQTKGFIKAIIDADSKKILGAAILGVGGDEIIHLFLDLMYADADYTVLLNAMHIHPTVSELIPFMLKDLKALD